MRQYCLLGTRIFDQPKASYLQLSMAVTPDVKRFSQAMKHQFPSFSAKSVHSSVNLPAGTWKFFEKESKREEVFSDHVCYTSDAFKMSLKRSESKEYST
jgi:hypothetical protein